MSRPVLAGLAGLAAVAALIVVLVIRHTTAPAPLPPLSNGPGWARLVPDPAAGAPGNPQIAPTVVTAGTLRVDIQLGPVDDGRAGLALWVPDGTPIRGTYAAGDTVPLDGGTLHVVAVHDHPEAVDVHLVPTVG